MPCNTPKRKKTKVEREYEKAYKAEEAAYKKAAYKKAKKELTKKRKTKRFLGIKKKKQGKKLTTKRPIGLI